MLVEDFVLESVESTAPPFGSSVEEDLLFFGPHKWQVNEVDRQHLPTSHPQISQGRFSSEASMHLHPQPHLLMGMAFVTKLQPSSLACIPRMYSCFSKSNDC